MESCNRILIVEDDKEILEGIRIYLKNQGYELVPISELIMRENFHMDVTGQQVAD